MAEVKKWFEASQAAIAMLMVQLFATGMQLLSKVVLSQGTFIFALMAYRHVVACFCVAPFAIYFERGNARKLNCSICLWIFLSALTGITAAMGLYYYGLRDTTATYATNFLNLIPIVTFVLSVVTRLEKLRLKTREGQMKTLGAIVCVAGALTASLYKGESFYLVGHHHAAHHHIIPKPSEVHWASGTFFLVGSCISYGTWFIIQVKVLKLFPSRYFATMLQCVFATIQSIVIGLCLDRSKAAWKLGWNLQLVTIIYSGALATAATFCLLSWAIARRGPTYPPMFNPLTLIFVAFSGALILGEQISSGILLGMVLIIIGLYSFLWGKKKEMKNLKQTLPKATEIEVVSTTIPTDSTTVQLSATIMPSTSPATEINIDEEDQGSDRRDNPVK